LSLCGDTLDSLANGTNYAKVKSMSLSVDGLVLMDLLVEGTYGKLKKASLSADGLVLLDNVVEGTYGLLRTTQIASGYIKLTSQSVMEGEWYNESGVEIDATHGINIYGKDSAFTTRASKTGTIQCKVDSGGRILAGAGKVSLDVGGVTIDNSDGTYTRLKFKYSGYSDCCINQYHAALVLTAPGSGGEIKFAPESIVVLSVADDKVYSPSSGKDLGSSTYKWRHIFGTPILSTTGGAIAGCLKVDVDGTLWVCRPDNLTWRHIS